MQVLFYNPQDNEYFVGLSEEEFEQVAREYVIDYGHHSDYVKTKEEALARYRDANYREGIKECYKLKSAPFVFIVVNPESLKIGIRPWSFPISPMWNGYSPWKAIVTKEIDSLNFHHFEMEYTCFSEVLKAFCEKWIKQYSDEKTTHYQLIDDMSFPNYCFSFGWKVDNGISFQEKYSCDSYEDALNYLPQVTDIQLLGNLLFSYWRYFNHWSYSGTEILEPKNRAWFVEVLTRLKELALTNENRRR